METIATLQRMSAAELSGILQSERANRVAVIDVRDDDHVGGHIRSSTHVPSATLDHRIPELVRKLAGKEVVVFHCALSQQRGPGAALRYIRERDTRLRKGEIEKRAVTPSLDVKDSGANVPFPEPKEQQIFVLDKGFVGWQEK